jgi:uncharacterized membrane protein
LPGPVHHVWLMYLIGGIVLAAGLLARWRDLRDAPLSDRLILLGPLFYAIPLGVFGTQHFVQTAAILGLMPPWIPGHLFFVLLVGACLIAAALSIATRICSGLASFLVAVMFVCFEALLIIPGAVADPHNRFNWIIVLREFTFCAGALSIAAAVSARTQNWSDRATTAAGTFARLELGIALLFFAVEQFLHPANVPGIPLELVTPRWIPGHAIWCYVTGALYLVAGLCLLVNRRAHEATMLAGAMLLILMITVYLPMLIAKPLDIEAIDYFFDTLLFSGSVLAIAAIQGRKIEELSPLRTSVARY